MENLNIRISDHARDVMRRRAITFDEVAAIVAYPQIVETQPDGRRRYVVDALAVVVAEDRDRGITFRTIITILLRSGEQWTDADAAAREQPF